MRVLLGALGCAVMLAACASSGKATQSRGADVGQKGPTKPSNEIRSICEREKLECRRNVRIVLRRKDGTTYDETFDWFLSSLQGVPAWVNVLPGETMHLELEADGNALTPRRMVAEPRTRERTITFGLSQDDKRETLLTVSNPFSKSVKYDLFMLVLEDRAERPRSTSSCLVPPRGAVHELWPDAIYTLMATNFRFVEGAAAQTCDAADLRERP
jgi:hypothetical protein